VALNHFIVLPKTEFKFQIYVVCLKCLVNGTRKQTNRRYKQINFIGLQNNRHASQHTVGNIHKASGNSAKASLGIDRRTVVTRSWIAATSAKCVPFMALFRWGNRSPPYSPDMAPSGARSGEYLGVNKEL
jgi:hypothetical protein